MVTLVVRIIVVYKILIIYRGFGPNILESSQGASPIIEVPRLSLVILILEFTPWQFLYLDSTTILPSSLIIKNKLL